MRDSSPLQPTADDELHQLMRRYQAGEVEAFEEIYARTLTMVRGYLGALTVDRSLTLDLVQDVYLQMHRSRQTYDPTRPVRPWVAGITRHVWLMARRSHARRRSPEVAGLEEATPTRSTPPGPACTPTAVAPGPIETPIVEQYSLPADADPSILGMIMPFGSMGAAADVASVYAFLASDDARHVNGQVLKVDGGVQRC